jgi:CheY-like chemotaxis protein
VAHDFNNLLTVIIGNSELLAHELRGDSRSGQSVELILKSGRQAAELTRRLLAFAREQRLAVTRVDPNAVVLGMEALLHRTLGANIHLSLELDRSLWSVAADESQLENALLNLAINARDAMPLGGSLVFQTQNAEVGAAEAEKNPQLTPGAYALIAVRDTGTGMSPDVAARAFDPFFTTKEVGKGTGLGLSIVYGFVKQSHGSVAIESEAGKGTCIRIYLPRAEAGEPVNAERLAEEAPPPGHETVLVVEDNPLVRASAVTALASLGYTVLEAEDASQALERLQQPAPTIDLLFTDVILPGRMNGPELAQAALLRLPRLKLLFTSGYSGKAALLGATPGNSAHLLPKPYRRLELARMVRAALRG